ncbi:LCP family protein [Microcoleus sp. FACHB-1515]|uniref:LCP family protein n=1 Tax=Cyanophyceae TaxID=3028117 RepID=UPI001683D2EA|nr:LCP family protein [Microcoleus sp. FACHB-1515]MBD2092799.1 LCP family protein [Microcoleus sp. FACHB-1515]
MEPKPDQSATSSNSARAIVAATPVAATPARRANWILWSFVFLITAIVSGTLGAVAVLTTPLATALAPEAKEQDFSLKDLMRQTLRYEVTRPVNVLVMGVDRVLEAEPNSPEVLMGRSDTMLLVRIDPQTNAVNVLSIPRDTQVEIPGEGLTKINYANEVGGPGLAARVVSHTLNDVPIDRYVRVSTDAFRELVDLLGGVEVYVPQEMKYTDNTQDLHIDLEQGWQTLNGEQAEGFARFRADGNGDIGRVQRQQTLIRALRERLTSPAVLPRLPQAIELMQKYVDTNLTLEEMLALVSFGLNLDRQDFHMVMLPGRFSTPDEYVASYWMLDEAGRDQVLASYFEMPMVGMMQDRQSLRQLRIAVQNASGEPDVAHRAAAYLQAQGFDNVYIIEDWSDAQQQTQIIAQRGDLDSAQRFETTLGLGEVVAASTGDLESDITLRVGSDWLERIDG